MDTRIFQHLQISKLICDIPHQQVQFSSVTQSCLTHRDPMDQSTPGLPVHHQLLECTQTDVHWIGDAIQPFHPSLLSSLSAFNLPSIRVFSNESDLCIRWPEYGRLRLSISPSNEYSQWIFLVLNGLISLQSKGLSIVPCSIRDSQESYSEPQF